MIMCISSQVAIHKLLKRREFDSRTLLHFQQERADGSADKAGTG
jgi:hypothetical protein